MNNNAKVFQEIVEERRSVRIYNPEIKVPEEAIKRSLSRALLSPNSSNLQLWEFYRIKTPEKKDKMTEICLNQKAASTAQELIAVVTRRDKWKKHSKMVLENAQKSFDNIPEKQQKLVTSYYSKLIPMLYSQTPFDISGGVKKAVMTVQGMSKPTMREVTDQDIRVVVHKSAALAAQTFMLSIKAEGYDSCPMEGFDSAKASKLLQLPSKAEITMIISIGKAAPEGIYGERYRVPEGDVIFEI